MRKTKWGKIRRFLFYGLFYGIFVDLKELLLDPYFSAQGDSFPLIRRLPLVLMLGFHLVLYEEMSQPDKYQRWRNIMKKQPGAWIAMGCITVAFVMLMVFFCRHAQNTVEVIHIVAACSILFLFNSWALIRILFSSKKHED